MGIGHRDLQAVAAGLREEDRGALGRIAAVDAERRRAGPAGHRGGRPGVAEIRLAAVVCSQDRQAGPGPAHRRGASLGRHGNGGRLVGGAGESEGGPQRGGLELAAGQVDSRLDARGRHDIDDKGGDAVGIE